ncbi:hypothetical protein MG293_020682 [Ovis ammon polii]|uniref:Inositol 1,4,5-trisphosphate/ryanodine receptor domain-containing protein n=1 Tax=Ovis ammon polii TaxID=230172 RepID=A0AAD4XZF3_OVIAM|nr:hypothetical protein MG293_020682 [Ovis ammon polii]
MADGGEGEDEIQFLRTTSTVLDLWDGRIKTEFDSLFLQQKGQTFWFMTCVIIMMSSEILLESKDFTDGEQLRTLVHSPCVLSVWTFWNLGTLWHRRISFTRREQGRRNLTSPIIAKVTHSVTTSFNLDSLNWLQFGIWLFERSRVLGLERYKDSDLLNVRPMWPSPALLPALPFETCHVESIVLSSRSRTYLPHMCVYAYNCDCVLHSMCDRFCILNTCYVPHCTVYSICFIFSTHNIFSEQDDEVVLQCTATIHKEQQKLCLAAEGFGNRLCFLESTSNSKNTSTKGN